MPRCGHALLLGGLVAALVVRRSRRRRKDAARHEPIALDDVAKIQPEPVVSSEALRAEALARAAKDPATAALVLRFWLGTRDDEVMRSMAQQAAE